MAEDLPDESDLIKYLDDEMLPAEKRAFEALLNSDAGLREKLENLRMAKDAMVYYGIQQQVAQARAQWKQPDEGNMPAGRAPVMVMRKYGRFAIAIAAASIIFAFVIIKGLFITSPSPDKIYQETFVDYNPGSYRSQTAGRSPVEKAYQRRDYTGVVSLGRQASLNAKEQLLLGIAYLHLNNPEAAIRELEAVEKRADTTYRQDAAFYTGLAYLKNKQYDQALQVLKKIRTDPHHLYHNQVNEKTIHDLESLQ